MRGAELIGSRIASAPAVRRQSIVGTSAILPSLNRSCQTADNRSYVNYTHLHRQTIFIPEGKQAQFCSGRHRGHSLSLAHFRGADDHHSGLGGSA
jgi:hypothetical protein